MTKNSLIKINDTYINMDNIVYVQLKEDRVLFHLDKFQKIEILAINTNVDDYGAMLDALDKKLIPVTRKKPKVLGKDKPKNLDEVISHFKELGVADATKNAENFYSHYESVSWYRGKTKIRNWKACVKNWKLPKEEEEKDYYKSRKAFHQ
jgi:hypothetical protein|tara:strand:+ start:1786 stop:2235 length:450 start_codon:yes stop_codon:yes gene_type:complete